MTPTDVDRENAYLKRRVAELTNDVSDLQAQVERLTRMLERSSTPRAPAPNPLSGGQ